MTGPDFRWGEAERIHVDHGDGRRHLFLGHLLHIKVRTHFARLFVGEAYENVSVAARLGLDCFIERREKRSATPVVDDSVAGGYSIKMRSYDDDLAAGAR